MGCHDALSVTNQALSSIRGFLRSTSTFPILSGELFSSSRVSGVHCVCDECLAMSSSETSLPLMRATSFFNQFKKLDAYHLIRDVNRYPEKSKRPTSPVPGPFDLCKGKHTQCLRAFEHSYHMDCPPSISLYYRDSLNTYNFSSTLISHQ